MGVANYLVSGMILQVGGPFVASANHQLGMLVSHSSTSARRSKRSRSLWLRQQMLWGQLAVCRCPGFGGVTMYISLEVKDYSKDRNPPCLDMFG